MRRLDDLRPGLTDWARLRGMSDAQLARDCADDPDTWFAPGMEPDPDDWRTEAEIDAGMTKAEVAHRGIGR